MQPENPLFGEHGEVRPLGQQKSENHNLNALNGSSAPGPEDEESWAKEIIAEAQLVSTRVLQRESDRFAKLNKMDQV